MYPPCSSVDAATARRLATCRLNSHNRASTTEPQHRRARAALLTAPATSTASVDRAPTTVTSSPSADWCWFRAVDSTSRPCRQKRNRRIRPGASRGHGPPRRATARRTRRPSKASPAARRRSLANSTAASRRWPRVFLRDRADAAVNLRQGLRQIECAVRRPVVYNDQLPRRERLRDHAIVCGVFMVVV